VAKSRYHRAAVSYEQIEVDEVHAGIGSWIVEFTCEGNIDEIEIKFASPLRSDDAC
jgi:hypothetical protein